VASWPKYTILQELIVTQQKFLCSNHLAFLKQSPYKALAVYKRTLSDGQAYFQEGAVERSRDCFGAALDSAEIILEAGILDPISAVNYLITSTILLSTSLSRLGDYELSQLYLVLARHRLDAINQTFHPTTQLRHHLNECIKALDVTYKALFKGWVHEEQFEPVDVSHQGLPVSGYNSKFSGASRTLH
tara:strand:- start:1884 stop:2447 length:564 start_codon:yes stop_codon:yes gene_type:complete